LLAGVPVWPFTGLALISATPDRPAPRTCTVCPGKAENPKKDPSESTPAKGMRQVQQMQQLVYAAAGFPGSGLLQSLLATETLDPRLTGTIHSAFSASTF